MATLLSGSRLLDDKENYQMIGVSQGEVFIAAELVNGTNESGLKRGHIRIMKRTLRSAEECEFSIGYMGDWA